MGMTAGHAYDQPAQKTVDGHQAFLKLKGHFLGVSNKDNIAAEAKSRLKNTHYHRE